MKANAEHTGAKASVIHSDSPNGERLVSIIIPFLNAERFIEEAIDSVFSQTYQSWELLLVNDGSSDRSPAIAQQYAREHPSKVSYLQHARQERRGISATRNLGIARAKGAYLAFLDADDVWMPNKLERQLAVLVAEPEPAVICGSSLYWHGWTGKAEDLMKDQLVQIMSGKGAYQAVDLSMLSVRESWSTPSLSCILVRRGVVEAVGNFEEGVGFDNLYEDQALYFKLGLSSKVLASSECWDKYRQHSDSVCAVGSRTGAHTIARLKFLQWALQYLASSNIARPDLREALTQELSAALPQRGPAAMFRTAVKRIKDLERLRSSGYRRMIGKVPGVRSAWHLGHAVKDAWVDSSARAELGLQQDFSRTDPWHYTTNELEKLRHRREVEMLDRIRGSNRFGRVLEVGCAEGVFTEILTNRCDSLLATDVSEVALMRARQRHEWDEHVTFAPLDLRVDPLPNVFDLIVVIHVLQYIPNPFALKRIREKLVGGLQTGGYLLIGSVTDINEFKERLWWSRYLLRGGQRINAFFAEHPALSVVDSAIHPLPGSVSRDILLRRTQ